MRHLRRAPGIAWAIAVALMCTIDVAPARAQSAADGFDPGADAAVTALAIQPADGKILVAGSFTLLGGGGPGSTPRSGIGRLHPDGSLDQSFNPGVNGEIKQLLVQPDGKILVAGSFTQIAGTTQPNLARLNTDGSIDGTFTPSIDGIVYAIALQANGRIVVGGGFAWTVNNVTRFNVLRLTSTGELDLSFTGSVPGRVETVVVQRDAKIVVGGLFDTVNIQRRYYLARLHPDGSTDYPYNPGANSIVSALALQSDGRLLVGGAFWQLGAAGTLSRSYLGRITVTGALDTSFSPSVASAVHDIVVQPDGRIVYSTGWTLVRLHPNGTVDSTFTNPIIHTAQPSVLAVALTGSGSFIVGGVFTHVAASSGNELRSNIAMIRATGAPEVSFTSGANGDVRALAVQRDRHVLVGGAFTSLQSGITPATRNRIGRLTESGQVDPTFNSGANDTVMALALQPDGRILAGGAFTTLGGSGTGVSMRSRIGRLLSDGGIDTSFYSGANGPVHAILPRRDGGIFVGGAFTTLGAGSGVIGRTGIGLLRADGTVDASYNPGTNGTVNAIVQQADNRLVFAGMFTMAGANGSVGTTRHNIARMEEYDALDMSFNPGANGAIHALAVQPDGKILVAGAFTTIGGGGTGVHARHRIARLNTDGSVDMSFDPGATGGTLGVTTMALQADGSIVIGGDFTAVGGGTGTHPRSGLARITASGGVDAAFDPGANGVVSSLALQQDGKVIAGGAFTMLGGGGTGTTARERVGRLGVSGPASQSLQLDQQNWGVAWSRSGTLPELTRTAFEWSADGTTYTSLTTGQPNPLLPRGQAVYIRARGFYQTGQGNGSLSAAEFVRSVFIAAPQISPATLPAGRLGTPYTVTLTLTGSLGPAFFLVGGLPVGLTHSNGVISGSPDTAGTYAITVIGTDTDSGAQVMQQMSLVIGFSAEAPTITSVFPGSGPAAGGTVVTVRGANFLNGATVTMDSIQMLSIVVVDSTTITFTTPAFAPGTFDVTVRNPDTQSARLPNAFTYGAFAPRIAFGLGAFPGNGGQIAMARGSDASFQMTTGTQLPWPEYNAAGGGVRLAAGDVDGDGLDEIVAGLDTGGGGYIAVLDDAAHGHALLRWIRVNWPSYNAANGEVWPAVGNLDGDPGAEIVAGLGAGGGGWFEIFDDASASYASLGWRRVNWPSYNAGGSGATHPAIGNLDGAGGNELIIGLGRGSNGWIQIVRNVTTSYDHYAWIQVPWVSYNAANGTTFPAAGDLDGDGRAEIVAGLGSGGGGWLTHFSVPNGGVTTAGWLRTSWSAYNQSSGETHPAIGNIDLDGRAEIVIGLDRMPGEGGWFEILDDSGSEFGSLGWRNVAVDAPVQGFRALGGATFPAIGRFR